MLHLISASSLFNAVCHPWRDETSLLYLISGSRLLGWERSWGRHGHGEQEKQFRVHFLLVLLLFLILQVWTSNNQHFFFKEHYAESIILLRLLTSGNRFYSFYITYNNVPLNPKNILVFHKLQLHFLNMKQHKKGLSGLDTTSIWFMKAFERQMHRSHKYSRSGRLKLTVCPNYQQQIPDIFHMLGHLRLWKANKPWAEHLTPPKGSRRQKPQLFFIKIEE